MITRDGDIARLAGDATLDHVAALLAQGEALIRAGVTRIDLSGATQVDSGTLALLLAWCRASRETGRPVSFSGVPAAVSGLAALYGVDAFLPSEG